MGWLDRFLGRPPKPAATRQTTVENPLVIREPQIAFLNLVGADAQSAIDEDRAAFASYFSNCDESKSAVSKCDVLVLYCCLAADGQVASSGLTLRSVVQESGATVVLLAWPNAGKVYVSGAKAEDFRHANVVMTLDRNGSAFSRFFRLLFERMAAGVTMPSAWSELAPQAEGPHKASMPATIFYCGAGQVSFAPQP